MSEIPGSLNELLVLLRPCFSAPTFRTFRVLSVGFVSQTRLRTVTGMLVGARLSGVWDHSRAHRFFSRACWLPDDLGLVILAVIIKRLIEPGSDITFAIDDTLLRRSGRKIWGAGWHYDPTANTQKKTTAWGNNWVVIGVLVALPFMNRKVCLPVLFRLWRPKRKQFARNRRDPQHPSKIELARGLVDLITGRFPDRDIHVVADSAYASKDWRELPRRVTCCFRLRTNARLNKLPPARKPNPGRGAPRKKGEQLRTLKQIALDPTTKWKKVAVTRYTKTEQIHTVTIRCLWYSVFKDTPIQVILIKDIKSPDGFAIALITTDLKATPAQIIERYADRWAIEVAFQDAKEIAGVGEARNRIPKAVQRTTPFGFLTLNLVIIWYTLYGHHPHDIKNHRARAPWYTTKTTPSIADMLAKLRRVIIAQQYLPEHPPNHTPQEIHAVQQAWAIAGI